MDNTNIEYVRRAIDASACIDAAWELVKRRFWLYVGAGLVTWLLIAVVPYANILLVGPMMGGFALLVLRDSRDEPVNFGTLFKGFERFLPLMLIGLVQSIPGLTLQAAGYAIDIIRYFGGPEIISLPEEGATGWPFSTGLTVYMIIFMIGFFLFSIVWSAALNFAVPLIAERGVGVGEAIRLSLSGISANIGGLIWLWVISIPVALLGLLALCVGIFVAMPVLMAANVFAYRQVFPVPGLDDGLSPRNVASIFGDEA